VEFQRKYASRNMPVILTGLSKHFGALEKKWTLAYVP